MATPPPYRIVSVERADPPDGAAGTVWHRYEISQGANVIIHGQRRGSRKAVIEAVEEVVALLNERRLGKRGRVNLVPTPKKNPPKA